MNPRPNFIAPAMILACALIVVGGIGTGLSQTGDSGVTAAIPIALQASGAAAQAGTASGTPGTAAVRTTRTAAIDTAGIGAPGIWVLGTGASGTGASGTGASGEGKPGTGALGTGPSAIGPSGTGTSAIGSTGTGPSASGAGWLLLNGGRPDLRLLDRIGGSPPDCNGNWSTAISTGSMAGMVIVGDLVFVRFASGLTCAFDPPSGHEARRWSAGAADPTGNRSAGKPGSPAGTVTAGGTSAPGGAGGGQFCPVVSTDPSPPSP